MGNQVRTPRPYYFKNGVLEFYVYKKEIYYKAKLWLQDGTTQIVIEDKKFLDEPRFIANRITAQYLSSVEVNG